MPPLPLPGQIQATLVHQARQDPTAFHCLFHLLHPSLRRCLSEATRHEHEYYYPSAIPRPRALVEPFLAPPILALGLPATLPLLRALRADTALWSITHRRRALKASALCTLTSAYLSYIPSPGRLALSALCARACAFCLLSLILITWVALTGSRTVALVHVSFLSFAPHERVSPLIPTHSFPCAHSSHLAIPHIYTFISSRIRVLVHASPVWHSDWDPPDGLLST